jgi:hypothetical protein
MPDALTTVPVDWVALEIERDQFLKRHKRFAAHMNLALIDSHVTPLDMGSLDEPEEDEAPCCPHCHGNGWFWAADENRPWREHKQTCWECES